MMMLLTRTGKHAFESREGIPVLELCSKVVQSDKRKCMTSDFPADGAWVKSFPVEFDISGVRIDSDLRIRATYLQYLIFN